MAWLIFGSIGSKSPTVLMSSLASVAGAPWLWPPLSPKGCFGVVVLWLSVISHTSNVENELVSVVNNGSTTLLRRGLIG